MTERPTCKWCGRRLRPKMVQDWPVGQLEATNRRQEGWGGYGDGLFCGLRCGYQWAVRSLRSTDG